ncbi:hypothetical protein [Desertivirga arenae]|uniref:hypothetical protein n=1 Tax=Desertivirga arenae TaxID=2810309 RepID=UPI001A972B32|nr:hypothetical protein [Pedobacter sp. SYSU D00823]
MLSDIVKEISSFNFLCGILGILFLTLNISCDKKLKEKDKEAIINHFKHDWLKQRAAKFLLNNYDSHYGFKVRYISENGQDVTDIIKKHDGNLPMIDSLKAEKVIEQVFDRDNITRDFLVRTIDEAVATYREHSPYSPQYGLPIFLNYVLPYRVGFEEINDWRPYMKRRYSSYLNTFTLTNMTLLEIIEAIEYEQEGSSQYALLMKGQRTRTWVNPTIHDIINGHIPFDCEDYAIRTIYALRSLGIPSAYEVIPLWGKFNYGHAQAAKLMEDGKFYPVLFGDKNPFKYQIAKMYRRSFEKHLNSFQRIEKLGVQAEDIPSYFNQPNLIDITSERTDISQIRIELSEQRTPIVAYLSIYNAGQWNPIAWSKADSKSHSIIFHDMGRKILYHLSYYQRGRLILKGKPFILKPDGTIKYIGATPRIKHISINVGNFDRNSTIVSGESYNLFKWDEKEQWEKIGSQKANNDTVRFLNVECDGLYKIEPASLDHLTSPVRPFTYSKNQQVWW